MHSLPRGGKNLKVKVAEKPWFEFFLKVYTQNHKKWPLTGFGSDFEDLGLPLKSPLRAKITFFNQFSARFLKWPDFGPRKSFFSLISCFDRQIDLIYCPKPNICRFRSKSGSKFDFSAKFSKKTAIFIVVFVLRIWWKSWNRNFALGCGRCLTHTLVTLVPEGSENHKQYGGIWRHIVIDDVISHRTPLCFRWK